MLAIVLENDQHSRDAITNMLHRLGYSVLHAEHVDEAIYFFSREKNKISLVTSSVLANYAEDLPISRFLLKTPELNLCPLLVSVDEWLQKLPTPFQNRFSRIDAVIRKPFYESHLQQGIVKAHERRSRLRNTLLIYGADALADLEESVFSTAKESHWKLAIRLNTHEELSQVLTHTEFRVGGLIIPAELGTPDVVKELRQFKRTPMGAATPVCILGDFDSNLSHDLRLIGDVFFEKSFSSAVVSHTLSDRLIHHWEAQHTLKKVDLAMKSHKISVEPKDLKSLLKRDPRRWESLAAAGQLFKDQKLLKKALKTNPYSPKIHLSLYHLSSLSERPAIAERAKFYCPRHPEILTLT
jgi:CheY-like chemotaxis protein